VTQTYVNRDPAHNSYWFPPGGTITLYLNLTQAPFSNADFRQGVSLALDRSTIAKKAVNGYMSQASLSGLILPNLGKWLDPSLPDQGLVAQNKTAALAAFTKAGYTLAGGKLTKNGAQASMKIVLPNSFTDWVAAATEVANELKAVGINATLDLPQYPQYQQDIQVGTFSAAIGGFGGTGIPYTDFNDALNSAYAAPVHTATANNFERFKNPTVDKALATLASATDAAQETQATYQLEQITYNSLPFVPLYYCGSWGLFSTKHYTGWPSASDPYTLPTNYNYALLTVVSHLRKA
jgi:peptide/nickel transport system substrate-binding protein